MRSNLEFRFSGAKHIHTDVSVSQSPALIPFFLGGGGGGGGHYSEALLEKPSATLVGFGKLVLG